MASAKDVYPPRDLPGRADNWGRRVEEVDRDLFDRQVQLRQSLDNGLRSTSGQLAVLARQIDNLAEAQSDLLGRESFATFWQGDQLYNTSVTADPIPGLSLSFTLTDTRTVRIQSSVQLELYAGLGFPISAATVGYRLNGSFLPPSEFNSATLEITGSEDSSQRNQVTVVTLFSRPPGTYLIEPWITTFVSSGSSVRATLGSTVVDILQRT